MNLFNKKQFFNLSVQLINAVIRFIFFLFLTKEFDENNFASYVLFTAAVGFAVSFTGLDFYVYSNREIVKANKKIKSKYITNQLIFSVLSVIFVLPCLLFIYFSEEDNHYVSIFISFLVIATEYLNQEIVRLLISSSMQIRASLFLLLRQSLWPLITFIYFYYFGRIDFSLVIWIWMLSNIITLIISLNTLSSFYKLKLSLLDFIWVKDGLKLSLFIFLGSIAYKGIFTLDRSFIQSTENLELLGAYGFYFTLAGISLTVIEPFIFNFFSVEAVVDVNKKNFKSLTFKMRKYGVQIFFIFLVLFLCFYFGIDIFLDLLQKQNYLEYLGILFIILLSNLLLCFSLLFHYVIYSVGHDFINIIVSVITFILFVLLNYRFENIFNIYSVPLFLLMSTAFMFGAKFVYYQHIRKTLEPT